MRDLLLCRDHATEYAEFHPFETKPKRTRTANRKEQPMPDTTTPSEAAMRAAREIAHVLKEDFVVADEDLAEIIDRETRCGDLREALSTLEREARNLWDDCGDGEDWPALREARAVLNR